jgi:hypothetical protein
MTLKSVMCSGRMIENAETDMVCSQSVVLWIHREEESIRVQTGVQV